MLIGLVVTWCGEKQTLAIESAAMKRAPELKVAMQEISSASKDEQIYQEIWESENLDSLVIASEEHQESSLSAYVQKAINQLKKTGQSLGNEKSQKIRIKWKTSPHPAILKTYTLTLNEKHLNIAQLFFQEEGKVSVLSYASTTPSHTKAFTQQIKSLQLNF